MTRTRPTPVRVAHGVALALALLALALSLRESILFLPLLAVAAGVLGSPFVEWTSVPASLRRVLPRAHALVLLVVGLTAWLSRSMGILLLEPEALPLVAAPILVPVWAAFVMAPRAFPPGRTLVPAVVAVLTFAGLNPTPEGYGLSLLPFPRDGSRNGFAEVYLVLAVLVVGTLWGGVPSLMGGLLALPVLALASLGFAAFGLCGTAHAKSWEFFSYFFTFWVTPMFIFSGTFFAVDRFPPAIETLAWLLPMTHLIAVIRPLTIGEPLALVPLAVHLIYPAALAITAFWLAHYRLSRRLFD